MSRPWTDVVAEKRAIRDQKLAKSYGEDDAQLDPRIIAAKDISDLTSLLETRQVTCEAVILAHIAKAKEAHRRTNCLTEICFDEALQQAKELDAFQQEHGKLKGPLHGVPVSLKDQFDLQGLDSTLGYVGRAFKPAATDCVLVKVLKQLGAVIIAKTNLPQSILWGETDNPLWGLTTHPMNPAFTPGGSTGGEGTLLALNGSVLGWGTDIGGSIRIPAHMNGLWGFKPSSARFSYEGVAVSQDGQHQIPSVVGPMARTLNTLTSASKAILEAKSWTLDPQLPPVPWKEDVYQEYLRKPLVVGVMVDDGTVRVHPPIERIFREFCAKLEAAGHELVPWDTSLNLGCIKIMDEHYVVDGGEDIRRDVTAGGEPFMPHVQALVDRGSPISVYEYWQLNKRKKAQQAAYNAMWNAARSPSSGRPVDVLLVPTAPHTAIPHRTLRYPGYTKLFNFLDYTALSFPAGKTDKALDLPSPVPYEPRNAADAWNWGLYDIENMDGYDVGLQILTRVSTRQRISARRKKITRALYHYLVEPLGVLFLLRFPPVSLTVLIAAIAFSSVYVLNIAIQYGFSRPPYNFSETSVGVTYMATGMGFVVSSIVGGPWMDSIMKREARKAGRYNAQGRLIYLPEDRMKENAWVANTLYPLSLLWFGWSMYYGVQFMVPITALFVFGFSSMLHFTLGTTMLTEFVRKRSSAGVAVNNFVRNILSCGGTIIAAPWIHGVGVGYMMTTICVVCSLLGFLGIWLISRNAQKWRATMDEALKKMD
ncbi:hypothetical protein NLU13_5028 [Sarocladium strictum]|uniref:Amidase domain-containing protein n=1 Tax=Sarocladium strictum TaxID=5046 RepID=A0AA39GK08_SARSR|nr:hypothetical protein NLU13_5028 [Sarocladium strictum]